MLNFKKRVWIIKQKEKGHLTDKKIASSQNVSRMTVNKIWRLYQNKGLEALQDKSLGRKVDEISSRIKQAILNKGKLGYGIRKIEGLLNLDGIKVSHNKIHRVLKEEGLVKSEPKKGRRKKYVRWERHHSNSLWQTDFCWQERLQCWLIEYLDDHSRFIVGIRYTKVATAEVAIKLFNESWKRCGLPREVLSDRGAQFYANIGGKSRFTRHLENLNVNHILASVKKPTTTGKIKRFWLTHNTERWKYETLQKFVNYYNYKRPHMSLEYQTPYEVFTKDLKV